MNLNIFLVFESGGVHDKNVFCKKNAMKIIVSELQQCACHAEPKIYGNL